MSRHFAITPELLEEMHRLVTASVSGTMSAQEGHRLEDLISQEVAVCDLYLDLVHDWKALLVLSGHEGATHAPEVDIAPRKSGRTSFVASDTQECVAALPVCGENGPFDISQANTAPASGAPVSYLQGPVGYFSSGWPVAYLIAIVIFGLGLLIGSVTNVSHSIPSPIAKTAGGPGSEDSLSPLPAVVGHITGMVNCKWVNSPESRVQSRARDPRLSTLVSLGDKFALSSGLMEITYDTGAKVILQGPVSYEVESKDGGYLSLGKLTARVDKKEERRTKNEELPGSNSSFLIPHSYFAVRTPTAIVTDLGTEFGVEVNNRGVTTSHVFHGLVNVQSIANDGTQQGECAELHENESAIVEKQSDVDQPVVRRVAIETPSFVRVADMGKMVAAQPAGAFQRWQAYSAELRRDPSLLAYYDFQQRRGEPAVLPNVADNGNRSLDGVIQQAAWTTGRMPSKHALLFQNKDDCVELNLPQTVDDLTLAAWVKPMSIQHETNDGDSSLNGILLSDNWGQPGQIHWQLDSAGCVVFAEFGIDREHNLREWKSSPAFEQGRLRRWTHLAVSMDRTGRVWFYVDGRLIDSFVAGDQERVPVCIGPARIGTWNMAPRTFGGRIDEMAIFGRLLSSDEIRQMFDAGKVN